MRQIRFALTAVLRAVSLILVLGISTIINFVSRTRFALQRNLCVAPSASRASLRLASVPTFDGLGCVTHPAVVAFEKKFSGYEYWMAFTPWPDLSRELVSIVASHDGVSWEVPPGLTNPVIPASEHVFGCRFWSDPELIFLRNGTMILYARTFDGVGYGGPGNVESIVYKTSTDGVRWGPTSLLFTIRDGCLGAALCPQVVVEPDGSTRLWYIRNSNGKDTAMQLFLRLGDSSGTSFGPEILCELPSSRYWHMDVQKVGSTYYMLATVIRAWTRGDSPLHFLTSPDGINWTAVSSDAIPRSGLKWDKIGYYKPSMTPVPGDLLRWNVWAGSTAARQNKCVAEQFRIGFFKDIQLPTSPA